MGKLAIEICKDNIRLRENLNKARQDCRETYDLLCDIVKCFRVIEEYPTLQEENGKVIVMGCLNENAYNYLVRHVLKIELSELTNDNYKINSYVDYIRTGGVIADKEK